MQDARPGGHPLHVARAKAARVAQAVAVIDGAGEDIGDGLDAAMGVPGKAAQVILGPFVAEIVEEQKGIKLLRVMKAEGAVKMDAGPFQRRLGVAGFEYGTDGHLHSS